jgi:hypothetical protein
MPVLVRPRANQGDEVPHVGADQHAPLGGRAGEELIVLNPAPSRFDDMDRVYTVCSKCRNEHSGKVLVE